MPDPDSEASRARRDLERLGEQEGMTNTPQPKRQPGPLKRHFLADDAPEDDRIEVWGRRIGRALSFIAVAVLIVWLVGFLQVG